MGFESMIFRKPGELVDELSRFLSKTMLTNEFWKKSEFVSTRPFIWTQ